MTLDASCAPRGGQQGRRPRRCATARRFAFEAFFSVGDEYSAGLFRVTLPELGTALLVLGGLLALAAARPHADPA